GVEMGANGLMMEDGRRPPRWRIRAAFAALCLLVSSSSLLPVGTDAGPSSIEKQSCFYGGIGLIALIVAHRRVWARMQARNWVWLRLAGVSVMLLGVPAIAGEWAQAGVPDVSRAALFALVPFVVVAVTMSREPIVGEESGVRRFFAPALAGFGGALFLLSFSFPISVRARTMFGVLLLAVVVVGFASAWIYRLLRGFGMVEALAVVCLSNALFLAVCGLLSGGSWNGAMSLISISSLFYLLDLLLLIFLLREMTPVRLAVRFFLVPLLAVLEGFVILRPAFTARMGLGLVLLVGAAGYTLLSRSHDSDAVLSIR
ncbi:MAG: hypothetical protein ABI380_02935, partial [Edaphobacter sp.]